MAASAGHHIPGTPYNWRHGWEPRNRATAVKYRKLHLFEGGGKGKLGHYRPDRTEKKAPADPLARVNLEQASDDQIADLFGTHADKPDVVDRLIAEMDRRDRKDRNRDTYEPVGDEPTEQDRRIAELVASGHDYRDAYADAYGLDRAEMDRQERAAAVDVHRAAGETRDETVRQLYREEVHAQWLAAEEATRGNLLSKRGQRSGVDPRELFSGPASRARAYASEELKRWWQDHPRQTATEFRADLLGRAADKAQAQNIRSGGGGREFGL